MTYDEYTSLTTEEAAAYMRDRDHRAVHEWLAEKVGDCSVLDLGCGNGALADYIEHELYVGVDVSGPLLKEAKRRHPDKLFIQGDISSIVGNHGILVSEVVVCKSVLVHLPSREHVSRALRTVAESTRKLAVLVWAGHPWSDKDTIQKVRGHFGREVYQNTYNFASLWGEFRNLFEISAGVSEEPDNSAYREGRSSSIHGFEVWEGFK